MKATRIRTPTELGAFFRGARKSRGKTLEQVYESSGLGLRFLSEFERGKENASLGRVLAALSAMGLDVLVMPRAEAERALAWLQRQPDEK